MHVLIDDLAWVAIGLAVVTVFFVISVAIIFLFEGLKILFGKTRRQQAQPSAATKANAAPRLPSTKEPKRSRGAAYQFLTTARHKLQKKLRMTAGGNHMPFRWGHR